MILPQIQEYLRSQQIDGWLLYDFRGSNPIALHVAGLTTSGSRRWFLWIPAQGSPRWLIHAIEGSTFRDVAPEMRGDTLIYVGWRELDDSLKELMELRDGSSLRIAMEYSPMNAIPYVSRVDAGMIEMVRAATHAEIVSSADLVQIAQAVLDDAQLASHRDAVVAVLAAKDAGFDRARSALASNTIVNEYDVQQVIMNFLLERGYECDHGCIVSVNKNAADPHYSPTETIHKDITPGDMLLIDLWAKKIGDPRACYADITWTGFCGATPPDGARKIFSIVAEGRDAAVSFVEQRMKDGQVVFGYEVDDACRDVIARAGYADRFIHRTGHSLGTTGHFNGVNIDNLETQDRRSLIPGVMFTIEPGIYLPTFDFDDSGRKLGLGIRSEINCIVHPGKLEVSTLPLQTEIIPLA